MILDYQKASLWKRASAFLLDAILLAVLATGLFWLLSVCTGYDGYQRTINDAYERISTEYGLTTEMAYKASTDLTVDELAAINAANAAIAADTEAVHAYQMVANLSMLIVTFGLLGAFLLLEFAVPMFFGNGQTVGKKVFSLGVMHTSFVRLRPMALFVRTVLGKFAIGTMPFAMTGTFLFSGVGSPLFLLIAAAILIAQIVIMITTQENAMLHDRMAVTVVIDLASQRIFETPEQVLEYKKTLAAEKAAAEVY